MVALETTKLVTIMPTIPSNVRTLQFFSSYSSLSNSADVTNCDTYQVLASQTEYALGLL